MDGWGRAWRFKHALSLARYRCLQVVTLQMLLIRRCAGTISRGAGISWREKKIQ